jgi:hypothetical protein
VKPTTAFASPEPVNVASLVILSLGEMPVSCARLSVTSDGVVSSVKVSKAVPVLPDLEVAVIVKLCEDLRETQRHALFLVQKRAATRLAMFLDLQEHLQIARGEPASGIHLRIDRSSIATYLGMTLAALGRAFRTLIAQKVISMRNRQNVKILDRNAFNRLADMSSTEDTMKIRRPA